MSAVLAVIARLEAVAAVTAIVGSRIYQGVLPQGGTFPKIRVQRVSEQDELHLRGSNGIIADRVQVDSVSDAADAVGIATALDAAIRGNSAGSSVVGWTGTVGGYTVAAILPGNVREGFDAAELRQYKVMRDLLVWWKP